MIIVVCTPKPTIRRPLLGDLFNIIYFETGEKKKKRKNKATFVVMLYLSIHYYINVD